MKKKNCVHSSKLILSHSWTTGLFSLTSNNTLDPHVTCRPQVTGGGNKQLRAWDVHTEKLEEGYNMCLIYLGRADFLHLTQSFPQGHAPKLLSLETVLLSRRTCLFFTHCCKKVISLVSYSGLSTSWLQTIWQDHLPLLHFTWLLQEPHWFIYQIWEVPGRILHLWARQQRSGSISHMPAS